MRRVFIIRKDLHLSAGKLAAMVGHCAEAYWMKMIELAYPIELREYGATGVLMPYENSVNPTHYCSTVYIPQNIYEEYVNGIFTKTICEARNKSHLLKAKIIAEEIGLVEETDFGFINDCCLTELTPENEDGTCTVGIWFKPLDDEIAHKISKKYQLYHE